VRIDELIWDEWNAEHIAGHNVEPEEVEEACRDPFGWAERAGTTRYGLPRYRIYGQTNTDRYLFIVVDREYGNAFYVVSARDMVEAEKSRFRRLRRR